MEVEWDSRPPPSSMRASRDWPASNGQHAYASTSLTHRRRTSVVHVPPSLPPPSQPIPSVPAVHATYYDDYEDDDDEEATPGPDSHPYVRPNASANLAAVAAFSQARMRSTSNASQPSYASTSNAAPLNPSESPSDGHLRPDNPAHQEIMADRLLLSPSDPQPSQKQSRPSSRRALTKALELAREAVKLDSSNDDPYGAIVAYGKSVTLLKEVMERVMRGDDSTESSKKRNGRRRSVVAQEEEVRRLKSIHDTYADRMNILSLIYSISPPSHSPSSLYTSSLSTSASASSTPASGSPASESSELRPRTPSLTTDDTLEDYRRTEAREDQANEEDSGADEDEDAFSAAIFTFHASTASGSSTKVPSAHPYATASPRISPTATTHVTPPTPPMRPGFPGRLASSVVRARASSSLPPPAPPPPNSPPPAPSPTSRDQPSASSPSHMQVPRTRDTTTGHQRTSSGARLAALMEENERAEDRTPQAHQQSHQHENGQGAGRTRSRSIVQSAQQHNRESYPLPPLPSPSSVGSPLASQYQSDTESGSPASSQFVEPKVRSGSALSNRSDVAPGQQPLVNNPHMGTIHQRRSKISAPPSVNGSPTPPEPPNAQRLTGESLPASTAASLGIGRSRASSQPGRRPSLAGQMPSVSFDSVRPPLPTPGGSRKASVASKLGVSPPLQLSINTTTYPNAGTMSPPLNSTSTMNLIPPPPVLAATLPTTPVSPLPPPPPSDPLRKPYHLMNLLRYTMTSKTGGYVTRRLHVPYEVWSQGGVKLQNLPEKVRVVEVLCSALEDVERCSGEYFGAGNVSSGMGLGIGSVGRKEGEAWAAKLEEFSAVCESVVANFGKKLGVGEGFGYKKTSWGGKLTRQFDKFTNGKNLDSPTAYIQGLSTLFSRAQLLDEHSQAVTSNPLAPTYAALPLDVRHTLDLKLRHSSEFFARVVLTFVIRDLSVLLDKYAKKCEKWLEE